MTDACLYGFSPENNGEINAAALQKAVEQGETIIIDRPGIYDLSEPVYLGDDTTVYFGAGVKIRRQPSTTGENGYVFLNKGAFTRTYNQNIKLIGLHLICNAVQCGASGGKKTVPGLRGHLSFFYVKNLEIRNFVSLDLPSGNFGIHICTFENIIIENIHVEGKKDAVHLGRGNKFVIRHGIFRTFDDPIALNAHDYASSNPQLGWIENGIIEDCYDMDDDETVGYFCRVLAGSWVDWKEGMEVQNSDTVVCNQRLYRVLMNVDGAVYRSVTPPSHKEGIQEYDGIRWVMVQEEITYNCGCRNVHFKDIFLQKKRPVAFSLHFDKDCYSRSYYPGSEAPVQENILFENIYFQNEIPVFLFSRTPVDTVKMIHSVMKDNQILLEDIETPGIDYPRTKILFSGTTFDGNGGKMVTCTGRQKADVKFTGSLAEEAFTASVSGDVTVSQADVTVVHEPQKEV